MAEKGSEEHQEERGSGVKMRQREKLCIILKYFLFLQIHFSIIFT